MYRGLRIVVIAPCFNEDRKIGTVVRRTRAVECVDEVVVVDDGSNDQSANVAREEGATVLTHDKTRGVGAALRTGFEYARWKADVIIVIAGNNKDEPREIPSLLDPIADQTALFVQGSRYLQKGGCGGDMPLYRKVATRLHPIFFSLVTGRKVTESTNGFRAFHVRLLDDNRIRLNQGWLNGYELEPYLYYKTLTLGYPTREVPVVKTYPPKKLGYTKMVPLVGWWGILRPLILLRLGLRR